MKNSLRQILYGYVFIFLAIRIGVDLLADPIGYFLIAAGCFKIGGRFFDGKIASYIANGLLFLSFPSVFIDFNLIESGPWYYYSKMLFAGEIVLTFYIFRMLKAVAQFNVNIRLEERTQRLFNVYIPASLLMLAFTGVLIAFEFEFMQVLSFALLLFLLGLKIAFLFLLNAFRKNTTDEKRPVITFGEGSTES
ncbi:hypothetical protein [Planococcus sp. CAU13]|uniref:hypothetical protein n=1 Tax=Planococcus sp. CAU13 TaxID=1541197 RepID=UPI00052FF679|nr:hypothetical protein [Planococcus sp. CAU13]